MTPAARRMLDELDRFLATRDKASVEVAAVLSAIRGPDSGNSELKYVTSSVIRAAAFPHCHSTGSCYDFVRDGMRSNLGGMLSRSSDKVDISGSNIQPHFRDHVVHAAKVLGLKVIE